MKNTNVRCILNLASYRNLKAYQNDFFLILSSHLMYLLLNHGIKLD